MQEIGRGFFAAAPPGWATGRIVYKRVGKTAEAEALAFTADGSMLHVSPPREVFGAFKELRAAMARPGKGAWFSATARFAVDGQMTWDFDYDNEPAWGPGTSPLHYLQEQELFPRDAEHIPGWMAERIREAQAQGGL